MRRIAALAPTALLTLALLTGCGDSETAHSPATSGSSSGPQVITVTVEGDTVTPNGDRVEVSVGQPIEIDVTADAPGEIHVHSEPEQELEYEAGDTTLTIAPISRPGVVDVESHTLDKTIVQLEAK